jgi:hypothetical protein
MEEAPENGKESSNSAHANGMNEQLYVSVNSTVIIRLDTEQLSPFLHNMNTAGMLYLKIVDFSQA